VRILIDEYFLYCHNRPYSLFHEETFKQRWEAGLIPRFLWQTVVASALPYSQAISLSEKNQQIEDHYVDASWKEMSAKWQHADEGTDLCLVQGMLLHSILDLNRAFVGWCETQDGPNFADSRQEQNPTRLLSKLELLFACAK
jgi:hypothetical protein